MLFITVNFDELIPFLKTGRHKNNLANSQIKYSELIVMVIVAGNEFDNTEEILERVVSRRLQLKANLMYQFVHKDSFIPDGLLLSHPPSNYNMRTISYFTVPYARTNAYYNSFFPHMLRIWNSLPISVVCAPSSLMFKKVILSYI